jgi:hypothetical protein
MERMSLAAALMVASAVCTEARGEDAYWYAQIDNDVAFGTDRWYTSGTRIARVKDGLELAIVQDIYTPDAKNWHPGKDDRAPAARLLASAALHDRSPGVFQTIELALGVRGPAARGRQMTDAIHHVITAPHVDWSRQLDNRVDARVALARSQSLGNDAFKAHFGATLGNQMSFAHAGLELRAGDAAASSAMLRFAPTPPVAGSGGGWSAYAGASLRAVGRNELITRNYDAFGPELDHRRAVTRLAAGVAWSGRWGTLALDLVQDAKEFDAQTSPQRFGSLGVRLAF